MRHRRGERGYADEAAGSEVGGRPDTGICLTYRAAEEIAGLGGRRRTTGQQLGWPATRVVLLAVSELASNTVRHSGGPGEMRLWSAHGSMFVQVCDGGELPEGALSVPPPLPPKGTVGGYGLALAGPVQR